MTATQSESAGRSRQRSARVANGIHTNYLEDGIRRRTTVDAVHGSGPGVTSYANWRLVIPALGRATSTSIAPDMVGFGYSDRPEDVEYSLDTWADQTVGLMDTLGIEKAQSRRQQLRWRHRAAHRHQASRPGRQARADGQHGRATSRSPRASTRCGATTARSRTCARCMGYFAYSRALINDELAAGALPRRAPSPGSRSRSRRCSPRPASAGSRRCARRRTRSGRCRQGR